MLLSVKSALPFSSQPANVSSEISAGGKNKVSFSRVVTFRHLAFWLRRSRPLNARQPVCLPHRRFKVARPSAWRHKTRRAVACLYSADKKSLRDLSHHLMKADEIRQRSELPLRRRKLAATLAQHKLLNGTSCAMMVNKNAADTNVMTWLKGTCFCFSYSRWSI